MRGSFAPDSLTDSEKLLKERCADLVNKADNGVISFSDFLSPREAYIISCAGLLPTVRKKDLSSNSPICFLYGGFKNAERKVFCALPSYFAYSLPQSINENADDNAAIDSDVLCDAVREEFYNSFKAVRIIPSGFVDLGHRDYLGALLGLGIDRSATGDIVIKPDGAYVIAKPAISDFIISHLSEVGRDKVRAEAVKVGADFSADISFLEIFGTVASERLDSVLAELASTSREKAKALIADKLVEHNYFTASDCDAEVCCGDVISVKRASGIRFGKYIIDNIGEHTKKGRVKVVARMYNQTKG